MDDSADIRQVLQRQRQETVRRIADLRRDFQGIVTAADGVATDDEHDPEGATIAFERAQVAALLAQAQTHLADIEQALARDAAGSYGTCERCGEPIGAARLAARPVARTCISCAAR